ncbi:MAG: hypothetical protein GWN99_00600 [Gemmatimonadetes bacterium]|uniref:HEAT repeat domain-containing protein n=1 Tax=Candidatus Kutchimonas denitrificans TaxID=3056748 RepID=A0AAE5C9N4_9BACT|nr:hypothetical protein [Gemmatimonadota bacterium]NIR73607.1 hypothetical protein [Candidatus Kutchimonas denitrificans]NIR99566.1 hypothetical protein [Gemmatimonadota bacterium]NIT65186.1 hypothetical protein [Gemmatimonadota bacterium]NIV23719.1 hypothetical protein [Gemmatimonadota bacterium]
MTARSIVANALAATLLASAMPASAQEPDSLLDKLRSPDWRMRDRALAELNFRRPNSIPPGVASEAIALLEREATQPRPQVEGEGYGEYLLSLIKFVLSFEDPASLRGMALLGIETSRRVQEFVASHGSESLPYLDEAWQKGRRNLRHAVMDTWAVMLSSHPDRLSRDERLEIMHRLLDAASEHPLAFAWAADIADLVVAMPVLERIAANEQFEIVSRRAQRVLTELQPRRRAQTRQAIGVELSDWLAAICRDTRSGPRQETCESVDGHLARARRLVKAGDGHAAARALRTFADRVSSAREAGVLTDFEAALLTGNATYLAERLEG